MVEFRKPNSNIKTRSVSNNMLIIKAFKSVQTSNSFSRVMNQASQSMQTSNAFSRVVSQLLNEAPKEIRDAKALSSLKN